VYTTHSRYIKRQELLNGDTGKVVFDESGDRINAEYDIINIHPAGISVSVGKYLYSSVSKPFLLIGTFHFPNYSNPAAASGFILIQYYLASNKTSDKATKTKYKSSLNVFPLSMLSCCWVFDRNFHFLHKRVKGFNRKERGSGNKINCWYETKWKRDEENIPHLFIFQLDPLLLFLRYLDPLRLIFAFKKIFRIQTVNQTRRDYCKETAQRDECLAWNKSP